MNSTATHGLPPSGLGPGRTAGDIGLWAFIGMASMLFALFIVAYSMRMTEGGDWSPIGMPWQLWLSTSLLAAGSIALQRASHAARQMAIARARTMLLAGGGFALLFVAAQFWAWQALLAARIPPAGNPAASFFYLLTAIHALHVAGGLVGWVVTVLRFRNRPPKPEGMMTLLLLTRYWHFLLVVWLILFATLGLLTPEIVRFICGLE